MAALAWLAACGLDQMCSRGIHGSSRVRSVPGFLGFILSKKVDLLAKAWDWLPVRSEKFPTMMNHRTMAQGASVGFHCREAAIQP